MLSTFSHRSGMRFTTLTSKTLCIVISSLTIFFLIVMAMPSLLILVLPSSWATQKAVMLQLLLALLHIWRLSSSREWLALSAINTLWDVSPTRCLPEEHHLSLLLMIPG